MNKKFFTVVLLSLMGTAIYAQYEADKWYIAPKVSFSNYAQERDWVGYSSDRIPPFQMQVDYGWSRCISFGALVGFYRNSYRNDTLSSNKHVDYEIGMGGVATYHFAEHLERWLNYGWDLSNFDLFLSVGVRAEYYSDKTDDDYNAKTQLRENVSTSGFRIKGGPSLGARYYLNQSFAMSIEAGLADMGMISMGLSWKLK